MVWRFHGGMRRGGLAGVAVVLAGLAGGCAPPPGAAPWVASGNQVTGFAMTIGQGPRTFAVTEYELVGQERPAEVVRSFRDRMLLISRLRGPEGEVEAYVTRHYADGARYVFKLLALAEPARSGPAKVVARGRAYPVGPDGAVTYHWVHQIELEVEPAAGRVAAKGW